MWCLGLLIWVEVFRLFRLGLVLGLGFGFGVALGFVGCLFAVGFLVWGWVGLAGFWVGFRLGGLL